MFQDREAAGRALAKSLRQFLANNNNSGAATSSNGKRKPSKPPIVISIPRGGIPVSRIVAEELDLDLDICLVRRIPGPTSKHGASIAAVTEQGDILLSQPSSWGVSRKYIECARVNMLEDIGRRRLLYSTKVFNLKRRDVIIVDDCIATGASMLAAIHSIKKRRPGRIIVAAPFCSMEAKHRLASKCDAMVVLHVPMVFMACAQFFSSFPPVTDLEVIDCLRAQKERRLAKQLDHDQQHLRNLLLDGSNGLSEGADRTKLRADSSCTTSSSSCGEDDSTIVDRREDDEMEDFRVHRALSWQAALEGEDDKDVLGEPRAETEPSLPIMYMADEAMLKRAAGAQQLTNAVRLTNPIVEVVAPE